MLRRLYHIGLAATWLSVAGLLLLWGLDYYVLPLQERPFAPGHDLFNPTGRVGNRLGIAGTAMMVGGVVMYSTRKRVHALHGVGRLRDWLSFHIFLCTLGPFLIVLHTSFKVGGLVSIAFWSMTAVVLSGIIGRYVYVRIPRALNGTARSLQELDAERLALAAEITAAGGSDARIRAWLAAHETQATPGVLRALAGSVKADLTSRAGRRRVDALLEDAGVAPAARARLHEGLHRHQRLLRERALLEPFQRVFRYWHAFHLPLAIVMLLIVLVHVAVAFAFGYAWTP